MSPERSTMLYTLALLLAYVTDIVIWVVGAFDTRAIGRTGPLSGFSAPHNEPHSDA